MTGLALLLKQQGFFVPVDETALGLVSLGGETSPQNQEFQGEGMARPE
jgi:hypothetical protein